MSAKTTCMYHRLIMKAFTSCLGNPLIGQTLWSIYMYTTCVAACLLHVCSGQELCVPYSGESTIFVSRVAHFCHANRRHTPEFRGDNFHKINSHKTAKFMKVFSPKVTPYMVCGQRLLYLVPTRSSETNNSA